MKRLKKMVKTMKTNDEKKTGAKNGQKIHLHLKKNSQSIQIHTFFKNSDIYVQTWMMETVMRGYIKLLKENRLMLVKKGSKLCCKKKNETFPLFSTISFAFWWKEILNSLKNRFLVLGRFLREIILIYKDLQKLLF